METVGSLIRHWRKRRRMSQLDLATDAEVSTRHLSFLETGRSAPSREMVLVLGSALEIPLRGRNTLLRAAGFAPAYRHTDLEAPEMAQVRSALEFVLKKSEPYGAVVVNNTWDVLMMNEPLCALSIWLTGEPPKLPSNLLKNTFDPDGLKPFIKNWEDVARTTLDRLHREAMHHADVEELYEELLAMPGVPQDWRHVDWSRSPSLLIPVTLAKDGLELSFFTTITRLGAPIDVTASELAIESYYPADEQTEAAIRMIIG